MKNTVILHVTERIITIFNFDVYIYDYKYLFVVLETVLVSGMNKT